MIEHYIVVKFIEGYDYVSEINNITSIFNETLSIDGVNKVEIKRNCVDKSNRYDLMIKITLDRKSLKEYANSEPHMRWKDLYGRFTEKKAIFDCDI